ncbi:MAG: hypothetical protein LBM99_06430 [Bacillales bacterium]|jgi:Ca2+/Na+ antiporter|nr:hypothetical protein [Bacillales bacterium]
MTYLYQENNLTRKTTKILLLLLFLLLVTIITLLLLFLKPNILNKILCIFLTSSYFFYLYLMLDIVILPLQKRKQFIKKLLNSKTDLEEGSIIETINTRTIARITFKVVNLQKENKTLQLLIENSLPIKEGRFLIVEGIIIAYEV